MVHLTIMVASPQDVAAEREYLEEIIRELNSAWGKSLGIYLDLMHWETAGYPAIGSDPQEVINEQLGDDYDIFIGLLWHRLGSPTPRAQSGTAEEFDRAHKKYEQDPNSVKIMFYFKNAPVVPSDIDPQQFAKVIEFRENLGNEGVLYWTFNDRENFGRLLRIHLTRQVQEWQKTGPPKKPDAGAPKPSFVTLSDNAGSSTEDLEEEGLFDLLDRGTEGNEILGQVLGRMTQTIQDLGERVKSRAEELSPENLGEQDRLKKAKNISNQAAADLEQFAAGMEAEMDLFSLKHRSTIDAWLKFLRLQGDFSEENSKAALDSLRSLKLSMIGAKTQMNTLQNTISTLPRMTTAFNRGKRKAVFALEKLDQELHDGILLLDEIDPDNAEA